MFKKFLPIGSVVLLKEGKKKIMICGRLQVSADTPQTFLWHTVTDDCVPVENSLLFFNALRKFKVSVEMHLYPVGGHGLSLASEETSHVDGGCIQKECQSWMELACKWIESMK